MNHTTFAPPELIASASGFVPNGGAQGAVGDRRAAIRRANAADTPSKTFVYDTPCCGWTLANTKGRMWGAHTCFSPCSSLITDEVFSYTARGEVSDVYESTPHSGGYYHSTATYWANGLLDNLSGAAGYVTNYTPDGEGRVYSTANGAHLASTTYNPASQPTAVNFASGDSDSFAYDPNAFRMTQFKFTVGATPQSVVGNLTWNANGTLHQLAITDPFDAANTQTCNYSYDDLARLQSGNCGSVWSQTFSYDAFGNITASGSMLFQPGYNLNNQMATGTTYDSMGDVLSDSLHSYAWNSDTRPITIDSTTVTYDAFGRMVEQGPSGSYTEIQYSPTGFKMQLLNGQAMQKAWEPMPGGAAEVWQANPSAQYFLHSDWLGSARLASTTSRAVYNDLAYAPFGEPYAQMGSTGVTQISFAGNNEDTTTNLYDAQFREYGIQGRWPSPDPAGLAAANPANPQSWDRYAYVLNNPLRLTDPTGRAPTHCRSDTFSCQVATGTDGPSFNLGCQLDGIAVPCEFADAFQESGGAVQCPDNACTGIDFQTNLPVQFFATTNGSYYGCELSGEWSTENAAGQAALACTAGEAAALGVEVGGTVNKLPNGQFTFGGVVTGTSSEVGINPSDGEVGIFNIEVLPWWGNEYISGYDIGYLVGPTYALSLYRGTPEGRIELYNPRNANQFPGGCVLVGSPVPPSPGFPIYSPAGLPSCN